MSEAQRTPHDGNAERQTCYTTANVADDHLVKRAVNGKRRMTGTINASKVDDDRV